MGRLLGIDFGTKRTGIAATDPLKIIVSPVATVPTKEVLDFLADYMKRESVEGMVFGHPGEENKETLLALERFVEKIKTTFPGIPVKFQDEHFTSRKASDLIVKSGLRRKKRRDKALVDRISAVLILQEYLGHLN